MPKAVLNRTAFCFACDMIPPMSTASVIGSATRDRLIIALDVPNAAQAQRLVLSIGDAGVFYKVGLELFTAEGPGVVRDLVSSGKKVLDRKSVV